MFIEIFSSRKLQGMIFMESIFFFKRKSSISAAFLGLPRAPLFD